MTDDELRTAFLEEIASHANITLACANVGLPRRTAYNWRETYPDFAKAWDIANELGTDALEDEAIRRGKEGTIRPVYQGGSHVGDVRDYSDTLLIFMLKARRPDKFKDRQEVTGKGGKPIQHEHTHSATIEHFRGLPLAERLRVLREKIQSTSEN